MNIGKGIKFVRIASGLRQGEMAKQLDISQNYLSLLENNKAEPSIALLKKISEVFGVPAGFIVWEDAAFPETQNPDIAAKYQKVADLIHDLQTLRIAQRFPNKNVS
ncbi:MAG: helix-turn-helix transcriptional regulator [Sedimentisphaerales bacterium]